MVRISELAGRSVPSAIGGDVYEAPGKGMVASGVRAAAATMRRAGDRLMQNGQAMMDYADRLRRGMGYK